MRPKWPSYYMELLLAAGFALGGISVSVADEMKSSHSTSQATLAADATYLAQNNTAMNTMIANMAVKPTGDIDRDFVAMMTPHHQGAIDMAQAELAYGHNQLLARVAQGIIVEQLQEIAAMRLAIGEPATPTWVTTAPESAPKNPVPGDNVKAEAPYLVQNDVAMNTMMTNMAVKPSGDVDHDFVAMMVPHHQGGIDMARAELRYGHDPQLMHVAQEIVVDQIQEIAMMRLALNEPLPPSISSPTQIPLVPGPPIVSPQTSMQMSPDAMGPMKMPSGGTTMNQNITPNSK
jgi:uncharacterized protein (DUF305 family)